MSDPLPCDCRESRRVDELPEAERRDLERRRDALLADVYRIRHTLDGGTHVLAIDSAAGGSWAWGPSCSGPTYHHALRAALAAHEQEASK